MSESSERLNEMNDLGVPVLAHYESSGRCDESQPGDWCVDEVEDVTCPVCLEKFEKMRKRRLSLIERIR